jgi:hypothetical protein
MLLSCSSAIQHARYDHGTIRLRHNAHIPSAAMRHLESTRVALERDLSTHCFMAFSDLGAKQGPQLIRMQEQYRAPPASPRVSTVTTDLERRDESDDTQESRRYQTESNTIISSCPVTTPVILIVGEHNHICDDMTHLMPPTSKIQKRNSLSDSGVYYDWLDFTPLESEQNHIGFKSVACKVRFGIA